MTHCPLLAAAVASLTLMTATSTAMAGLLAPPRLTTLPRAERSIVLPRSTGRGAFGPATIAVYQADPDAPLALEVLSPGEAIEKLQDLVEQLIVDDSMDASFGDRLLSELDDVVDALDAMPDNAGASAALDDVGDSVHEGVAGGDLDANAGELVNGMITGVHNMLID